MEFYWEEVCQREAVAKLNTIPGGELQYSAPLYFYEFTTRDAVNHSNDGLSFKLLPKSQKTGQTRPNKKQGGRFGDGNRIGTRVTIVIRNSARITDRGQEEDRNLVQDQARRKLLRHPGLHPHPNFHPGDLGLLLQVQQAA